MITDPEAGQTEAPLATALDVFRIALVTFAREVANRDDRLAVQAFEAAQTAVEARLGGGPDGAAALDAIGLEAAVRNALRLQLRRVLTAARAVIDQQANDGTVDAGG